MEKGQGQLDEKLLIFWKESKGSKGSHKKICHEVLRRDLDSRGLDRQAAHNCAAWQTATMWQMCSMEHGGV